MEDKKEICFLDGGPDIDFTFWYRSILSKDEYKISELTNLYAEPEKLHELKKRNPWGIFIGTTGVRPEHRKILIETFLDTGYIPEAIIFADDTSTFAYQNIASDLKKNCGTKVYQYDLYNKELRELNWV